MMSYLQIDYVSTVQVEGVQIFNWKRDFVEPIEGYVDTYSGVQSFRIEHGTNKSELNSLQQVLLLQMRIQRGEDRVSGPPGKIQKYRVPQQYWSDFP